VKVFLGVYLLFVSLLIAQSDTLKYRTSEIVVTSLHQPCSLLKINKNIEVFNAEKFEGTSVSNMQDILDYSNSVQLNQRGTNGVQADVSIRGGTFEQTLVMLDGIKIIDPQTGHHNLNLPVTMLNVEQIEIVKGSSSGINGANAFSGLINYRTKRERENSFTAQLEGGDFGFYSASFFGSYNSGRLSNNVAFEQSHSNGYRKNTEYDISNFSYGGSFTTGNSVYDLFLGYTNKKFGANSFYSHLFPLQYEHIKTTFAKISAEFGNGKLNYSTKIYWRKNDDEFLLDKTNPNFYKNNHLTDIYGVEFSTFINSRFGKTSLGGEFVYDEIASNNLGNHNRNRVGFYILHGFNKFKNFDLRINGYLYNYSNTGLKFIPGVDLGYFPVNEINIFTSYSKGFRIPTYTELFYNSPTAKGKANLLCEETDNYEIGIKYFTDNITFTGMVFIKNSHNLIDWILLHSDFRWEAMNVAEITTEGMELNFFFDFRRVFLPINSLEIKYTYLNSSYSNGNLPSLYLHNSFRHQLIIAFNHYLPLYIDAYWNMRYEKRFNGQGHFITDIKLSRAFENFMFYVKATNLFATNYYDYVEIPLPGRWVVAGIKLEIK
jgi:iron complex outermembrane receptor protein